MATKKCWTVKFTDGTKIQTPYYANSRMAVGYALSKHKGKITKVHYG